jgi:hypothetical protein
MRLVLRNMKTGEYCSNGYGWTNQITEAKLFYGNSVPLTDDHIKYIPLEDEQRRIAYNEKHGKWKYVDCADGGQKLRRVKK